jgi:hypothetical protein
MTRGLPVILCILLLTSAGSRDVIAAKIASSALTFERDVRPILKANCFHCHGEGQKLKGDLDLRLRRLIVKGGESGPAIVPGDAKASELYERVASGEMPPGNHRLSGADVAIIRKWIKKGATTDGPEPQNIAAGMVITNGEREFWSFRPLVEVSVPRVQAADRVRTPIDAFLLSRLEDTGLTFNPDADRVTLIRRATYDLIGLPPSPDEVKRFLKDHSANAYERLLERLLASPRYGERWGRHWLDVAGYADSEGFDNHDKLRPFAYKYRDYVIRALNSDKPLDEFIQEQLAGDEMVQRPYENLSAAQIEKLVATGFLRMASDGTGSEEADQNVARNPVITNTVRIVSTALLGLTVGCAECHHHRYDPIPQEDFYAMRALFEPSYNLQKWLTPHERTVSLYTPAERAKANNVDARAATLKKAIHVREAKLLDRAFEKQLATEVAVDVRNTLRTIRRLPKEKRTVEQQRLFGRFPKLMVNRELLGKLDPEGEKQLKAEEKRLDELLATRLFEDGIRALTEMPGSAPVTRLFHRGDPRQPRQAIRPGGLTVLNRQGLPLVRSREASAKSSGRRLSFAKRLTGGTHPLTTRLLVNRIWLHHFGRGIVPTPGDFGRQGLPPTHPQLLDWLAQNMVAHGWRLKRIHRLIMLSTAYRQSSRQRADGQRRDDENRLYWRMPLRRLEAEAIRDSILAVSGRLNLKMYGPAVPVKRDLNGKVIVDVAPKAASGADAKKGFPADHKFRRSIYIQVRRSQPVTTLGVFDFPKANPNCVARDSSTVATQSLMLMNSEFLLEEAKTFAERIDAGGRDKARKISQAFWLAFARGPRESEVSQALSFLKNQETPFRQFLAENQNAAKEKQSGSNDATISKEASQMALVNFCQALLSANEFLYVD